LVQKSHEARKETKKLLGETKGKIEKLIFGKNKNMNNEIQKLQKK